MIILTGCRPNEALKSLESKYWKNEGGFPILLIPGYEGLTKLTKTGYDYRWVFKSKRAVGVA